MSELSDDFAAVGLELITEFGQAITFERANEGAYDPASSETSIGTPLTFEGVGAPQNYKTAEINGQTILQGDMMLLVNKTEYAPIKGDKVTVGAIDYRVQEVMPEWVNGVAVMYTLQVRV